MAVIDELRALLAQEEGEDSPRVFPEPAILTIPPVARFITAGIPPEASLYINRDEHLAVHVWNSVTGATLTVLVRLLRTDGQLQYIEREITPSADRLENTFVIPLTEGFLVNVTVDSSAATIRRGQCFVALHVLRSLFGPHRHSESIASGYVSSGTNLYHPGRPSEFATEGRGHIRPVQFTIEGDPPIASLTVPANTRWRVIAVRATGATAINKNKRSFELLVTDPTTLQLVRIVQPFAVDGDGGQEVTFIGGSGILHLPIGPSGHHGYIERSDISAPGAGQEVSINGPDNDIMWVHNLFAVFTTSSQAGTRQVFIDIDHGGKRFYAALAASTQGPSAVRNYTFSTAGVDVADRNNNIHIPIPPDLRLSEDVRIRIRASGIQSGDTFTDVVMMRELLRTRPSIMPLPQDMIVGAGTIFRVAYIGGVAGDTITQANALIEEWLDL